jgi:hypothetical protein
LLSSPRPDQFDLGFDVAGGAVVDQFLRLCDVADSRLLRTSPISFSVVPNLSTFKTGQPCSLTSCAVFSSNRSVRSTTMPSHEAVALQLTMRMLSQWLTRGASSHPQEFVESYELLLRVERERDDARRELLDRSVEEYKGNQASSLALFNFNIRVRQTLQARV